MLKTGERLLCRFHVAVNDDSRRAIHKIKGEIESV